MPKNDLKEYYALWREYLKRSEKYKKFCDNFNKFCDKENLPIQASDWPLLPLDVRLEIIDQKVPKELKKSNLWGNLSTFGDVFNDSFEKWFEIHQQKLDNWEKTFPPVQPYAESVEFKAGLPGRGLTLQIDLNSHHATGELKKMFADIIRKARKKPGQGFNIQKFMKAHRVPSARVDLDPLRKYLKVYDLRIKGWKYQDIIQEVGTRAQAQYPDEPETQDAFQKYNSKAKKTIKNVENGIFP